MTRYEIQGGGGLPLSVHETGNREGHPILFLHGLMQCGLSWAQQMDSALARDFRLITVDMRGHGLSGRAETHAAYQDPKLFADDVAAVIADLGLDKPVLVGASYAGLVINDYLTHYGDAALGGINYVATTVHFGNDKATAQLGDALLDLVPGLLSEDLAECILATRRFVRLFYATQPSADVYPPRGR